jgi:hypothetical protein
VRRITQLAGALAATTLAVSAISAGTASAAAPSATRTKAQWQAAIRHIRQPGTGCWHVSYPALQWHASKCVTAPRIPFAPGPALRRARHAGPAVGGGGIGYAAKVSGLIAQATGTFQNVSPGITEQGQLNDKGPLTANVFSLQLNSQAYTGSGACEGVPG